MIIINIASLWVFCEQALRSSGGSISRSKDPRMGPVSVCFLFLFFFTWTNATLLKVPGCFHLTLSSGLFLFSRGKALGAKLALTWLLYIKLSISLLCFSFGCSGGDCRLFLYIETLCFLDVFTPNCLNLAGKALKLENVNPIFSSFNPFPSLRQTTGNSFSA